MKDKYLILIYSNTDILHHFQEYDSLEEANIALSTLKMLNESQYGFFNSNTSISLIKSLKLVKVTEIL